jgi:hypothetical protein
VDLSNCKDIVGVGGISVSQVDNTIFIVNERVPAIGIVGNIAIYADPFGSIKPAGIGIKFDNDSNELTVEKILTTDIDTQHIESDQYCITVSENNNVFAKIGTYQYKDSHKFAIFLKKNTTEYSTAISIDQQQRVSIEDGRLNLRKKRTIISSIGNPGDHPGDVAIDTMYLYYCHSGYNGKTPAWVRWKITDSSW